MNNDLVERVARVMAENNALEKHDWRKLTGQQKSWWMSDARFAIAVVVEECAKALDARYMGDNTREDMEARRCAAAIRALAAADE